MWMIGDVSQPLNFGDGMVEGEQEQQGKDLVQYIGDDGWGLQKREGTNYFVLGTVDKESLARRRK